MPWPRVSLPPGPRTQGSQDVHGTHGRLDVEPELLQGQEALPLQLLQLRDQDQVLFYQCSHGGRQGVVHLPVLEGGLFLDEPARKAALSTGWVRAVSQKGRWEPLPQPQRAPWATPPSLFQAQE